MSGILALVGSGEFTKEMAKVDRFLLSKIAKPKVAILPTAAGLEPYHKWINDGISHFKSLGADVEGVELVSKTTANDPKIVKKIEDFNFYYFSGGDPGYLLDTLKDSLALKTILKNFRAGAILVGASAGAMVFGKMVWARVYKFINHGKTLPWENGLGVVDFGVIPHYDTIEKEFSKDQIKQIWDLTPQHLEIFGIDEDTAYIKDNNDWQVMGKGKVHKLF